VSRRAADTRQRLVLSAVDLFSSSGFERTSVREVERHAHANRGLVAYHFGDKEALWRAAVEHLMSRFHDELVRHREYLLNVSAAERSKVLLRIYVAFQAACPQYMRFLVAHGDDTSERMQWLAETYLSRNLAFFRELVDEPVQFTEADAISHFVVTGAASFIFAVPAYCRLVFDLDPTDPDFIRRFADVVADMFAVYPQRERTGGNSLAAWK
jgi:TetR/AcrR family transcriptional regulator